MTKTEKLPERKPNERQSLRRIPGYEIRVEYSVTKTVSRPIEDPNNYYQVLGLSSDHSWSALQVQQSYRRAMKKYHPDGTAPDPEMYTQVAAAYDVLSDPEKRESYDALEPGSRWIDQALIDDIAAKLAVDVEPRELDLTKVVAKDLGAEPDKRQRSSWDMKRQFDHPVFYYDTEQPPPIEQVNAWAHKVVSAAWSAGFKHRNIKLGFTQQGSRIVSLSWGTVLMIDEDFTNKLIRDYFELDQTEV